MELPRKRSTILRSKRGLVILSITIAAMVLYGWWSRAVTSRPGWQEPLTEAEVNVILAQLDIQPTSMPVGLTTWFNAHSAGYNLNVKCIFQKPNDKAPFSAYWIAPSNQWDLGRFAHETSRLRTPAGPHKREGAAWRAHPLRKGDLFYMQGRQNAGSGSSERCYLVRTEGNEITLYIHQSGSTQDISRRAVLKRYPIREWGLLPIAGEYSPTCMRWWP
jgi:hypothetical protein